MDRATVYFGQNPLDTDVLRAGQYAMTGLAKLSEAVLGTTTCVSGFSAAPTAPASLSLTLGPGQIYEQENLEASTWGSLPADTHVVVKQGILLDAVNLTFTPPATVGYSQCFLIEVQYQDSDTLPVVLPYYNAANPAVSLNGPSGNGAAQPTARKGAVAYQIKAGIAATSGTQVAPTPDAGWAGLYVVTLAYGATTVTAGNIVPYGAAPFIPVTLPGVPGGAQSGTWTYAIDNGVVNAAVIATTPALVARTIGMRLFVKFAAANTSTAPTINDGLGAVSLLRMDGSAPKAGDFSGTQSIWWDGAAYRSVGPLASNMSAIVAALAPLYTASAILYVRNDATGTSPTGLTNAVTDAFPTLDAAIAFGTKAYYFPGGKLTIQLGVTGTYAPPSANVAAGSGTIVIQGDPANQASYILQGTGPSPGGGFVVGAQSCVLSLIGLTVSNTGTINSTVGAFSNGVLSLSYVTSKIVPAGSPYAHVYGAPSGQVNILPGCIFSGSAGYLMLADAGIVEMFGNITFSGAPTFSIATAAAQDGGKILAPSTSYTISGTAAGPRYAALGGGVINTSGGGANFFPGSSAGSTASGGQYL